MAPAREPPAAEGRPRAVVIDADSASATAIAAVIASDGYDVEHYSSSDAGLQALSERGAVLVVLDDRTHALGALAWVGLARPLLDRHKATAIVVGRRPEDAPNFAGVTFLERPFADDDLREAVLAAQWARDPDTLPRSPPRPTSAPPLNRQGPASGLQQAPAARAGSADDGRGDARHGDPARADVGRARSEADPSAARRFKSTLSFSPKHVPTVSTASTVSSSALQRPLDEGAMLAAANRSTTSSAASAVVSTDPRTHRHTLSQAHSDAANGVPSALGAARASQASRAGRPSEFSERSTTPDSAGQAARRGERSSEWQRGVSSGEPPTEVARASGAAGQQQAGPQAAQQPRRGDAGGGPVSVATSRPSGMPQIAPARPSDEQLRPKRSTVLPDNLVIADRYELRGVLGSGGMAIVYRAHDRELDEDVALKLLKGQQPDESSLSRFRHELRICRRLQHPAIVQTFEFGVWQGRRFLTMELLEGTDLANLLHKRQAPLEALEAAQLFSQAARGLDAAHRAGVIHRDIKPHNLFVLADGQRMKIMDFGIAKSEELSMTMTNAEQVLGTPAYLAPERLRDQVELSPSTDLYSLGVAMYQALTGKLPFSGPDVSTLLASVLLDVPKPPRHHRSDIPVDFEQLVLRCLQRDPSGRSPSCGVLAEELDEIARRLRRVFA